MELKFACADFSCLHVGTPLIEPYGIEIAMRDKCACVVPEPLIEPYGIEIKDFLQVVLVVVGTFNRTLWN